MCLGKNKMILISIIGIVLFLSSLSFASEYTVPKKPASVDVADIDLDGDLDIVIGHDWHGEDYWGLISILENDGNGNFFIIDTLPTNAYENSIQIGNINNNEYSDIIANDYNENIPSPVFSIINDYALYGWNYISQFCYDSITIKKYIIYHSMNDNLADIVFVSNINFLWGVMYNDGTGEFSSPEYYYLDYPPTDLAVGDLNGDDRDDILIVGGQKLDAWLNYETGLEYTNIIDSTYAHHAEISDIDNDGDNDIVATFWGMAGSPKKILIYSNDGFVNFTLSYSKWIDEAMAEIFVSDLNNDNYPDIIYNCSLHYPNSDYEIFHTYILFNNQDGTFQDPVNYYTGICSHKSHSADLDGNGWNDIITLNYDFYQFPVDTCRIHILFNDGTGNFVEEPQVGVDEEIVFKPELSLSNYPNPFNTETIIKFSLLRNSDVIELNIYNIKGQLVCNLIDKKVMNRGIHSVTWDGKNNTGKEVNSNVYLYRLRVGNKSVTKKTLLVR